MSEITVVQVPSLWTVKIPNGPWLNLAHARKMTMWKDSSQTVARIFWFDSGYDTFSGYKAEALISAWEQAHALQYDVDCEDS